MADIVIAHEDLQELVRPLLGLAVSLPWKGYVFQILTSQGASMTGGARNYIVGVNMTLGYALAAVPAEYDYTGRDTFVISHNGTIFQQDVEGGPMPLIMDPKIPWNSAE